MSTKTQYQPISTAAAASSKRRYGVLGLSAASLLILVLIIIVVALPLTFFYGLEYYKRNQFSTKPSYCRINAVEKVMIRAWKLSSSFKWNIDIVKQPQNNSSTKDLIVLRSNITGFAWDDTEQPHLRGQIYPCYIDKKLLDDAPINTNKLTLKLTFQWKKPRETRVIVWFSISTTIIALTTICVCITILWACCG